MGNKFKFLFSAHLMEAEMEIVDESPVSRKHDSPIEKINYTLSGENPNEMQRSKDGFVIFVSGLHPEVKIEDIQMALLSAGGMGRVQCPLDKKTSYVKGYALSSSKKRKQPNGSSRLSMTGKSKYS